MKTKRILSVLLAVLSVLLLFTISASALTWDGSSAGGSTSAVNGSSTGYVIRSTDDSYCVVGYRFSVVNSAGNLKVNKVIDVYRNTTNGDNAYSTSAKFSTKYNKKQLIANKNATLTTTYNKTNCYKEKDIGFVSKLPNPSGVETWQAYETNINKVLSKIGVGSTANMVYGDKVIIEPLFDVCLAGEYQALTVTEIAYCGRAVKGGSSDGGVSNGTSSTWGFISNYTNRIWPNKLYTPNGQGLWTAASALSSKATFDTIMTKGYGAGIAYNETTRITYTIAFNGNGATSGSTASMSMVYGTAKNLTANGFKRTGYKFTGWSTKANGSGTKNSDKQSVNNLTSTNGATVTLYAQWTPNVLTVMYDCNGSNVTIDKSKGYFLGDYNRLCSTTHTNKTLWGTKNVYYATYKYNDNIGTNGLHDFSTFGLTAPTGYKFKGWYCGNGKTFDETTTTYKPTDFTDAIKTGDAEIWLSARFSAIKYKITHDPNGGGWGSDKAKDTREYTISGGVDILVAPTKTGYAFKGWKVTSAAGNWQSGKVYSVSNSALSLKNMYGDVTLTAQWTPITYNVKFNGNGSTSGSMSNQSHTYDKAQNLSANAFSRAFTVTYNYNGNGQSNSSAKATAAFGGWATSAGGSKVYNDKQSVKNLSSTQGATINLYAKWTDASVTLPTPARTGYVFNGWYTAASGGTKIGAGGAKYTPTKNITLYAQWSPISYNVKFNGNGSTSGSMSNQSHTYDTAKALTANAFKREFTVTYNYNGNGQVNKNVKATSTFGGWATSASGNKVYNDKQSVKNLTSTSGATVNLYAKWTDASVTLPTPTRTGYVFNGWFTAASGGTKIGAGGASYKPSANITLYAQWSPITYSVKFNGNGSTSGSMANQSFTYDVAQNLSANAFKRSFIVTYNYNGSGAKDSSANANATFNGWATSSTGKVAYSDKQSVKNLSSSAGATINLYANWTDASVTLPTPTRTGYTFSGWYTSASGGTKIGTGCAKYTPTKNITLYAQWAPVSYSVKFNGNGSTSGSMSNQSHTYDTAKALTANAFKRAFTVTYNYNGNGKSNTTATATATFNGWATSASGSKVYSDKQSVKNLSSTAGSTVNLYAKWTDASVTLPTPTRTGYTFSGWYTSASGGTKIGAGGAGYTPSKNITLYAQWSPITYTIKFVGNGSTSGSMANMTMTYDAAKNLTDNAFKRTGYSFTSWNTKADGGGTKYTNKQSVKNLTTINGATITLYAQWTPDSYTIKFNGNGSTSGTMSDLKMTYDVAKDLTANAYKRTGYTFKNWNTKTDGTGTSYADKQSVKNLSVSSGTTITLYAQWTPISYSIKFNGNGATSGTMANLAMTYDVTKNLMENAFKKTGYVFSGWATTATGKATYSDKQSVKNLTTTNGATINLYAVWTPITYTVKFNGNNSTSGTMSNLSMTYDTAKTLTANAFKRTGYTFGGWNTAADGSGTSYTDKQSVKNLTSTQGATVNLYAKWNPISYTVKYNGNGATSGTMANQSFVYDKAQNLSANAFKREFTITYNYNYAGKENTTAKATAAFGGWATSASGSVVYSNKQSVKNLSSTNGAVVNVYAKWTDKAVTLPTPARTGYVFDGWYTSASSGTKIGMGGGSYTPGGNITVYAHWTPISYTIRFNGNGSTSGAMSDQKMTYDTASNLTANAFVKTGAKFVKWNTKADGTGTDYADKQSVKNLTTENGKVITLYAQWKNLRELSLEAITPNAAYRESTEVITSFNLVNKGEGECLPTDNVSVVFKVYKDSTVIKTVTQSNVVVPGNEKNLLFFKWTVPSNLGSSKIYVSAEIVENGGSYGLIKNQYATCKYNVYATPDTQYEASAPDGFTAPNAPTATSETAKWSVWTYENGSFKKVNYGMAISDAAATITPDESANAKQQNGGWVMKSGYGYGISVNNGIKTLSGYSAAPSSAYTNAQYALALFPEFGYAQTSGNSRTLELVSGKWIFRENDDYGRIHFTPLWYPDGPYTATVLQSDCWTPAGMISRKTNTNTITISGSAYDDWFIG